MSPSERFQQLFSWDLDEYQGDFSRIRNGGRFYNYGVTNGKPIKKHPFGIRALVANIWTPCLLIYEEAMGRFKVDRLATSEEDQVHRQDAFINGGEPIQYKIRDDYPDFNAVRFQPYISFSPNLTRKEGRDFCGLRDHTTQYHYAAIWGGTEFERIYRIDSSEFFEKVQELDSQWDKSLPIKGKWRGPNGIEVHHIKHDTENFSKINFYIPPRLFNSLVDHEIPAKHRKLLNILYGEMWKQVTRKHIIF